MSAKSLSLTVALLTFNQTVMVGQESPQPSQISMIICDGAAKPLADAKVEVTVENNKSGLRQNNLYVYKGQQIQLLLPELKNQTGSYTIYTRAPGYKTAVTKHLHVDAGSAIVYVMLVPNHAGLNMEQAHWQNLASANPQLLRRLLCHENGTSDCSVAYEQLLRQRPDELAALLNISMALQQIEVGGRSVFSYYQSIDLEHGLFRDRLFAYADKSLTQQLKAATAANPRKQTGEDAHFTRLRFFQILHRHATSSFKETDLDRANLQLTFHERETLIVNGIACARVDTDIDYYRRFAHGFKEVIPNLLLHKRSSPQKVFQLRWLATKNKQSSGGGIADFSPLIELKARHQNTPNQ